MPCELVEIDGLKFWVKTSKGGGSGQKCRYCDRSSTRLCDFEIDSVSTCDAPMCDFCTHRVERTMDYCPEHRGSSIHEPRKDINAPRWMKATYTGTCRLCFKTVYANQKMLWFKQEKKLYCEPCGKAILEDMKKI